MKRCPSHQRHFTIDRCECVPLTSSSFGLWELFLEGGRATMAACLHELCGLSRYHGSHEPSKLLHATLKGLTITSKATQASRARGGGTCVPVQGSCFVPQTIDMPVLSTEISAVLEVQPADVSDKIEHHSPCDRARRSITTEDTRRRLRRRFHFGGLKYVASPWKVPRRTKNSTAPQAC